ncbi:MAG: ATP-binding protein, partial [Xanthobacteraceae bacterium]
SGLGLALVRQIARHHGGDAVCLAAAGGGSRFRVVLPAVG